MLTYMPRDKVRHEYVSVTPDGFRFRRQNFESLNLLMKWFKVSFVMIFLTEQKLNIFPAGTLPRPDPRDSEHSGRKPQCPDPVRWSHSWREQISRRDYSGRHESGRGQHSLRSDPGLLQVSRALHAHS